MSVDSRHSVQYHIDNKAFIWPEYWRCALVLREPHVQNIQKPRQGYLRGYMDTSTHTFLADAFIYCLLQLQACRASLGVPLSASGSRFHAMVTEHACESCKKYFNKLTKHGENMMQPQAA